MDAVATRLERIGDTSEPIFTSTHAALSFAFSDGFACYPRSIMARLASSPSRTTNRPSGIDGAAQAGLIIAIIDSTVGESDAAIIAARFTKRSEVCACGRLCCAGHRPYAPWLESVLMLCELMRFAVPETSTNRMVREQCVRKYFGERVNLAKVARECKLHSDTVSKHNNKIVTLLKVGEKRTISVLSGALEEAGIVGR